MQGTPFGFQATALPVYLRAAGLSLAGIGLASALSLPAGRIRLRPILMTTFALIAGMVPIALGRGEGADWRAPLGRAVIGGTLTSTLLTLIPTVYEILDEWKEGALAFFKRRRGHAEEPTAEEIEEAARQLVPVE